MTRTEYAAQHLRARLEREARLTRQDARISRCPGCDDWCWDKKCTRCNVKAVAA